MLSARVVLVFVLSLGFPIVVAAPARADQPVEVAFDKTRVIAVEAAVAMPTGNWGDAAGFGVGALARIDLPLDPRLTLTGRVGYLYHMYKEVDGGGGLGGGALEVGTDEVPIFGGARYVLSQKPTSQLYGAAELGFVWIKVKQQMGDQSDSSSDTQLGMSLGGGYRSGSMDLRGSLFFPDAGELGDAMGLLATVGFDVGTL